MRYKKHPFLYDNQEEVAGLKLENRSHFSKRVTAFKGNLNKRVKYFLPDGLCNFFRFFGRDVVVNVQRDGTGIVHQFFVPFGVFYFPLNMGIEQSTHFSLRFHVQIEAVSLARSSVLQKEKDGKCPMQERHIFAFSA